MRVPTAADLEEESFGSVSEGTATEGESESESTEQEYQEAFPSRTDRKGKASASPAGARASTTAPPPKKVGSWTDLDLSIIVALVSPIGNWLTGGDHIKNLFLIILMIFYLHQIIEIPWQLYLGARPRRTGHRIPSVSGEEDERVARLTALAHTELHWHEIVYIALAVLSPLGGAMFLRHVLSSLGEQNTLSWFSTTLFVLATGIRPWSHFVNRLQHRTHELHTTLHYPDEDSLVHMYEQTNRALQASQRRIDALERELGVLRESLKRAEQLREVCDDLTDVLSELERAGKRNERKADAGRAAQSVRLTALEQTVVQLEQRRQRDVAAFETTGMRLPKGDAFLQQMWSSLISAVDKLLYVPRALIVFGLEDPCAQAQRPTSPKEFRIQLPASGVNGNGTLHTRIRSPDREKHLSHLVPRLATIPEAENSDSEETFVSDKEAPSSQATGTSPHKHVRKRSISGGVSSHRHRVKTFGQRVFEFAQDVVLCPYRFSVRVLVALLPPVKSVMPGV
ncbi:hypothetical protein LXA43DRAFT_890285 [Ganoderma leucocontextum]|nr:hypothetical protein LXA43DRAFT_890285 [Ganoderma leucocontextum]